jgi:molybdate transport system substrate-binding protein
MTPLWMVLGLLLAAGGAAPPPITVSAAISLTDALEAIARDYAAAGGGAVRFNFAGSNTLARQLVNGAPADLFISADEAQMDVAARAGVIDPATRINLLANRLALVTRRGGPAIASARDLSQPGIRRIAIGEPAGVPAGVYARRYLETLRLWDTLQDRMVPVANVRAALTAVTNGSADAAIVYQSDTASADVQVVVIDGRDAPDIAYPAAILQRSTNRAAAVQFLAFLRGPQAAAVFARYKFIPLSMTPY